MNVLVWKSYGQVKVLCVETTSQLDRVLEQITSIAKNWDMVQGIEKCIERYENTKLVGNRMHMQRVITEIVEALGEHETFEYFQFQWVSYD